jgi:hypothetical protein
MTSMSGLASTPFTVHDLEGMPDDGRRYELIDGELLVSRYQEVVRVVGDDVFEAHRPFPVRVVPNELLGHLRSR